MNPCPKSMSLGFYARSRLLYNDESHSIRRPAFIIALPKYDQKAKSFLYERDRTNDSCDQDSSVLMSLAEGRPLSEERSSVNAVLARGA